MGARRVVLSRMHCNVEFYYIGKIPRTGIGHPSKQRCMVLRRRNTIVGGKCALRSAVLVMEFFMALRGLLPESFRESVNDDCGETNTECDGAGI